MVYKVLYHIALTDLTSYILAPSPESVHTLGMAVLVS